MSFLLARQPIFHKAERVAAYELLSRCCSTTHPSAAAGCADRQLLADVFLGAGLAVTHGLPAFIRASPALLLDGAVELVDPARLVLQVEAPAEYDPVLHATCARLIGAGYHFAIDYTGCSPASEPLLELATFVKVDARRHDRAALHDAAGRLGRFPAALVAVNVECREAYDACVAIGFEYFQGLLFSRPETFEARNISIDHVRTFRLMKKVGELHTPDTVLEEEFRADPALSFKLLRMVNSAAHGGRGIRSIGHALRLVGRDALHRWLAIMILNTDRAAGIDAEITRAALVRARMCELLGDAGKRPLASGTLFILGLLSAIETFIGIPADALCRNLHLAPELAAALTARRGPFGACLALVEAYEDGQWDVLQEDAGAVGVDTAQLAALYLEALGWAAERIAGIEAGFGDESAPIAAVTG